MEAKEKKKWIKDGGYTIWKASTLSPIVCEELSEKVLQPALQYIKELETVLRDSQEEKGINQRWNQAIEEALEIIKVEYSIWISKSYLIEMIGKLRKP